LRAFFSAFAARAAQSTGFFSLGFAPLPPDFLPPDFLPPDFFFAVAAASSRQLTNSPG